MTEPTPSRDTGVDNHVDRAWVFITRENRVESVEKPPFLSTSFPPFPVPPDGGARHHFPVSCTDIVHASTLPTTTTV